MISPFFLFGAQGDRTIHWTIRISAPCVFLPNAHQAALPAACGSLLARAHQARQGHRLPNALMHSPPTATPQPNTEAHLGPLQMTASSGLGSMKPAREDSHVAMMRQSHGAIGALLVSGGWRWLITIHVKPSALLYGIHKHAFFDLPFLTLAHLSTSLPGCPPHTQATSR